MQEIAIEANSANQRLDKFLLKYLNTAPKSFVYKMLRKKRIKINNKRAEGSEMLTPGDTIQLYLAEDTMTQFMEERTVLKKERRFGIVFENESFMAVSKPAGLLTHRESAGDTDTLVDQAAYYLFEKGEYRPKEPGAFAPAACNRLDRNTSGLVLFGKTLPAVQELNRLIAEKQIGKYYLTIVVGQTEKKGTLQSYLKKDDGQNQVFLSDAPMEGAKKIATSYQTICTNGAYSLLLVSLMTGKSHQIRAQFAKIGHPIIGDQKYGDLEQNRRLKQQFGLYHQLLHAWRVEFPKDNETLGTKSRYQANPPGRFLELAEALLPGSRELILKME